MKEKFILICTLNPKTGYGSFTSFDTYSEMYNLMKERQQNGYSSVIDQWSTKSNNVIFNYFEIEKL